MMSRSPRTWKCSWPCAATTTPASAPPPIRKSRSATSRPAGCCSAVRPTKASARRASPSCSRGSLVAGTAERRGRPGRLPGQIRGNPAFCAIERLDYQPAATRNLRPETSKQGTSGLRGRAVQGLLGIARLLGDQHRIDRILNRTPQVHAGQLRAAVRTTSSATQTAPSTMSRRAGSTRRAARPAASTSAVRGQRQARRRHNWSATLDGTYTDSFKFAEIAGQPYKEYVGKFFTRDLYLRWKHNASTQLKPRRLERIAEPELLVRLQGPGTERRQGHAAGRLRSGRRAATPSFGLSAHLHRLQEHCRSPSASRTCSTAIRRSPRHNVRRRSSAQAGIHGWPIRAAVRSP